MTGRSTDFTEEKLEKYLKQFVKIPLKNEEFVKDHKKDYQNFVDILCLAQIYFKMNSFKLNQNSIIIKRNIDDLIGLVYIFLRDESIKMVKLDKKKCPKIFTTIKKNTSTFGTSRIDKDMGEIDYQLAIKTKINKMDNNLLKMYFFYTNLLKWYFFYKGKNFYTGKKSMNFKLRDTIEKTYYTNIRIIIIFTLEKFNVIFKKYNSKCEEILNEEKNYKKNIHHIRKS